MINSLEFNIRAPVLLNLSYDVAQGLEIMIFD